MQKHRLLLSCFLLFTLLFVQCDKPPLPVRLGKVYVAGGEMINYGTDSSYNIAKLWIDGKAYDLPSDARHPQAEEVFVDKTDVYVAGSDYGGGDSRAVLWKNMRQIFLSKVGEHGQAHSVFVYNKDVYVSGSVYRNGEVQLVIWKNGVGMPLNYSSNYMWSLFVYNNDLFATGSHTVNGIVYPAIYKNMQPQVLSLPPNSEMGEVLGVYVHKGVVYATGYIDNKLAGTTAALWINGKYSKLEINSLNVIASGVTVTPQNDVYVTGSANNRCIVWKNGNLLYDGGTNYPSWATSIAVSGKDVYVAGSGNEAVLWKNNIPQVLPVKKGTGYAFSVFVK